ncbi:hypothetical protein [Streptomyces carpinensis]|uniref:Uncharacterized protein n=1 Tax=Streptomyces carpinensis TaxID=66369 RepID=A0ABV1VZ54_9ACTN|nr:hypothetical protein [Streptomyces carpinensis]
MPPALDPLTVQRLAYVRYLYREGIEQSRQPAPLRSRAITSFHDAVENYVGLVAQHLGVELPRATEFLGYWGVIKPKFELSKKEPMRRLNDARVSLKHNGTFPSEHQIEQARETLADFFTTVTPKVFGVDFDSIDMVDLLTQADVAHILRDAQTHADIGDYVQAVAGVAIAFDTLLRHYSRGDVRSGPSPFNFGRRLETFDAPRVDGSYAREWSRLGKLTEFARAGQDALTAMSLGIDYTSMARFKIITPRVDLYANGERRYLLLKSHDSLTADDYEWARHFVIESGLRASRADEIREMQERRWEANRAAEGTFEQREWTGPVKPE